ncbi:unnamed protein product, partial [Didymodactylos carnosus]
SVSGPGITYAHSKIEETKHFTMEMINKRVFNIFHDRDLVPWFDKQEGLTQIVSCPKKFNRFKCHTATRLFCNVVKICGNPRNFTINPAICE